MLKIRIRKQWETHQTKCILSFASDHRGLFKFSSNESTSKCIWLHASKGRRFEVKIIHIAQCMSLLMHAIFVITAHTTQTPTLGCIEFALETYPIFHTSSYVVHGRK